MIFLSSTVRIKKNNKSALNAIHDAPGCKLEFNVNFDNILLKNKIKELQRQTKLQFKAIIT